MTCPHCRSSATSRRRHRTELGYRRFRCRSCGRRFNERTGSGFNELHYPTDIMLLAVLWRLRYKLGFRDVAELLLQRGYEVTHETIRGWETRFAPLLGERLRAKRRGHASRSWYIDETYDRPGRAADRLDAEREARQARGSALPPAPRRRRGGTAVARHHRPSSRIPKGDPLDPREEGPASDNPVPKRLHGARPSRGEAAVLPDARLRELRVCGALLLGVRRVAAVLPLAPRARRIDASR